MTKVADKTVLVTGAAMGMGRLHAQRAAERGAKRVVLWDINRDALDDAARHLSQWTPNIETYIVDVSNVSSIEDAARQTLLNGTVDVLFNNAGIVVPGDFLSHSPEQIDRTIRINTLGVMYVARAFLPAMIKQGSGHLVNISSASALMPLPYGSVYAASKWACYCWSESVRLELEDQGHRHVHVTTVCPSFVATGMFEGAKAPFLTRFLTTEEIVDAVWKGLERNKILVLAPFAAHFTLPMRAMLPTRVFDAISRHFFGISDAMKNLRGRSATK